MLKLLVGLIPHARESTREGERVKEALKVEREREQHVDRLVGELKAVRKRNHFGENARLAMERKRERPT